MQSPEFNKLMSNQQAMWAELGAEKAFLKQALKSDDISVDEKRQEIAKEEVPIPDHIQAEINKFINQQKELGIKNRTIRRMVMRKWNIKVV